MDEFQFAREYVAVTDGSQCAGPTVRFSWPVLVLEETEQAMESVRANPAVLWDRFDGEVSGLFMFTACAAHWMGLSAVLRLASTRANEPGWSARAERILRDLFFRLGWDGKEIANLMTWQRVRLT